MENGYAYSAMAAHAAIQPFRVAQNSAMRIVLGAPPWLRIRDMEEATGLQDIHTRLQKLKTDAERRYRGSPLIQMLDLRKEMLKK